MWYQMTSFNRKTTVFIIIAVILISTIVEEKHKNSRTTIRSDTISMHCTRRYAIQYRRDHLDAQLLGMKSFVLLTDLKPPVSKRRTYLAFLFLVLP